MLSAYSATVVAVEKDGGVYHDHHFQDVFDEAWDEVNAEAEAQGERPYGYWAEREWERRVEEDHGLRRLIRYSIDEMESSLAYEVEMYPSDERLLTLMARRDALEQALLALNDNTTDDEAMEAVDKVEDIKAEIEQEIEDRVDTLSKVRCDECGEVIE